MKRIKTALITGITGQDGSYLTELLLEKGYEVHGIIRKCKSSNKSEMGLIQYIKNARLILHYGDLSNSDNIFKLIKKIKPDEIYNLGGQSHVGTSFDIPEYTADVVGLGALRILEAIKKLKLKTKFFQASSSEMFGKVQETPQKETTPFHPCSPYGCAKLFAYWMTINYRENYNIFACNGILFNHESPRRSSSIVTKKIIESLVKIKFGKQDKLFLGNLEAKKDWGYALDYVEGMWLMLQAKKPGDFILSTKENRSVREFTEESAKILGINIKWIGKGVNEKGLDKNTGKIIIEIDPKFFRPVETGLLIGDNNKAKKELGWKPKTSFKGLVKLMVEADLEKIKNS